MTLRIHNIMYDHSQEFRTYPAGVITIDALTRAIHVHDGLTPNGWEQPTRVELGNYALKDLTNVTQESMNNALNTFGALNMNNADQVSTTQRDNAWTKLFGPAMLSNADIPENNYLYVDKKDRKMKAGDFGASVFWGFDVKARKDRQLGVTYKTDYPALLYIFCTWSMWKSGSGTARLTIDGVPFDHGYANYCKIANSEYQPFFVQLPLATGQTYKFEKTGGDMGGPHGLIYSEFKARSAFAPTTEG